MNRQRSLIRKVIFAGIMALLLIPMSLLAQPAEKDKPKTGGWLAQMRDEEKLSQANLGEIDPTSEAMKLASLGLRGVYATILWNESNKYKEQENWTALSATLEQITKLQPNFISVWRFQGWNLAFNLSVEMDDYRYRYYWVTRGIEFIDKGRKYNEHNVMLLWDQGWTTAQKIGRADEVVQYRRLFADDEYQMVENLFGRDQMLAWKQDGLLDNWYVGRDNFLDALRLFETDIAAQNTMSYNPAVFFSEPTKCLIRLAAAREKEGEFGEIAAERWKRAYAEWTDGHEPDLTGDGEAPLLDLDPRQRYPYGSRYFSFIPGYEPTTLMSLETLKAERDALIDQMASKDIQERILRKKLADQLAIAEKSPPGPEREGAINQVKLIERGIFDWDSLTPNEKYVVKDYLMIFGEVKADDISQLDEMKDTEFKERVNRLRPEAIAAQNRLDSVRQGHQLVNYQYWRERCEAEAHKKGLAAREELYEAVELAKQDRLTEAIDLFEAGFKKWDEIIDGVGMPRSYYSFVDDGDTGYDMVEFARRYEEALVRANRQFPNDTFPLWDVITNRNPVPPIGNPPAEYQR